MSLIILSLPHLLLTDKYASFSRLLFLTLLAVGCFILTSLIAKKQGEDLPFISTLGLVGVGISYTGVMLWLVYGLRYLNYTTIAGLAAADTAIFEQSLWNSVNGHGLLYNTIENSSHFAVHNSPLLILLAVGYGLFPHTLFLYLVQTLSVVLTAFLLFLIGVRYLAKGASFCLAVAYLAHPIVLAGQFTFHESFFTPVFFLVAVYFVLTQRFPLYILAVLALLTVNERAGLVVLGLSLTLFGLHRPWSWIAVSLLLGLAGLITSLWILSLHRTPGTNAFSFIYFQHLGQTPEAVVQTIWQQPGQIFIPLIQETRPKILLWYSLVRPFGLVLPFGSAWGLSLLPEGLFNSLASGLNELGWHYTSLVAILILGTVVSLAKINSSGDFKPGTVQLVLATTVLFHTIAGWPLTLNPEALAVNSAQKAIMEQIVAHIPDEASVCTDYNLLQYFSRRPILYGNHANKADQLATCQFAVLDRRITTRNLPIFSQLAGGVHPSTGRWQVLIDAAGLMLIRQNPHHEP